MGIGSDSRFYSVFHKKYSNSHNHDPSDSVKFRFKHFPGNPQSYYTSHIIELT